MADSVTLDLLDVFTQYNRVKAIWLGLSSHCDFSYFLSWGWIDNWISTLPRTVNLRLAVVSEGRIPVLAFFLGKASVVRHAVFRSVTYFLNQTGDPLYDSLCVEYNSVLCRSTSDLAIQQLLELLPDDWDEVFLSAIHPEVLAGMRFDKLSKPYKLTMVNEAGCPYVDLEMVRKVKGDYLSLLSGNTRSQIQRAYRLYGANGAIVLEVGKDLDHCLDIYEELATLHESAWKAKGAKGAFASSYFYTFHKELIQRRLAEGEIQLLRIRSGRLSIGCLYNFVFKGRVYFYQSGMRYETDNRLKPGLLCHTEAIKHNCAAGHLVYDFMAGSSRYKQSLSTKEDRLIWVKIQKPRVKFWVETRLHSAKRIFKAGFGRSTRPRTVGDRSARATEHCPS